MRQLVARPFNRTQARLCLDSTRTRTAMTAAKGHARRRRARLASFGAALLGTISFALRASRCFGGFCGFHAAALLRAAQHPCPRLARRLPLRRLGQPSRRRAAPRSPRLAWRHSRLRRARLPSLGAALVSALALDSRVSCCVGGLGGFRAASLRRPRLVSLGAALLGIITFASPVGRRFGWLGRPLRRRAAPRFPRFTGRRTAQPRRLCLVRRPPLRRLWRLSLRRARLASLGAALLGTITFASRVGRRYDGFGGLRAAALRCARLCLAHRLPLRRLWRLSLDSAALLSPIALT